MSRPKASDRLKQLEFDLKLGALIVLGRRRPKPGRYLLCRPRGGLNDCLRQMQKCWRYSVLHRRTLIVDTGGHSVTAPFGRYFQPRRANAHFHLTLEPGQLEILESLDCQVPAVTGRVGSYEAHFEDGGFFERESGERHSFDFEREYDAPLLVHHQCGGGRGVAFLSQLRLASDVAEIVRSRIATLPSSYLGIHVRNSDVHTDYKAFFDQIREEVQGERILLCSDDLDCLTYAREFFANSEILSVSDIPDTGGARLWDFAGQDPWKTNVDSLVDVIALAGSTRILRPDRVIGYPSGFVRLAIELHSRPRLLKELVGSGPGGPNAPA